MLAFNIMRLNTVKKTEVEEVNYGVLRYQMPDGRFLADDEGRYLCLATVKGDQKKIESMRKFVKDEFGIEEGRVHYTSALRPITDEEYDYQKQRLEFGLTPDPLDVGAAKEALKHGSNRG